MMTTLVKPLPYDRSRESYSTLQQERLLVDCSTYLPDVLKTPTTIGKRVLSKEESPKSKKGVDERVSGLFPNTCDRKAVQFIVDENGGTNVYSAENPLRIGVVLSGGQAPGTIILVVLNYF